ncbi:MAG: hypothetical protein H9872_10590 [Candidatus Cellulosilyticum pullistercoris]|uniref:DUF4190 domain-containing protein n=1 Tax=Candidatus Cellulosilyticum pullistercoris TaxID=2838521 RepID=A0A9E2KEP1_9FIRM|nr:hypothetical protein [Candidatus Cellulosilyticum pullistercoris]
MAKKEYKNDLEELNALDTDEFIADDIEDDDIYDFSKPESDAGSWTSLVLGIIGSLGWIIPIIGLPITIVGTVFGAINMKSRKSKGVAIAGFVINLVFLVASVAKGILDIIKWMRRAK